MIAGLRPAALDDYGLAAAIRQDLDALRRDGLEVHFEYAQDAERLPPALETALYRVAQEALTNILKHARADRVEISLRTNGTSVCLEVRDTGLGFDATAVSGGRAERVGLAGMRERVGLVGGELTVTSRPGEGTRVTARVPLGTPTFKREAG